MTTIRMEILVVTVTRRLWHMLYWLNLVASWLRFGHPSLDPVDQGLTFVCFCFLVFLSLILSSIQFGWVARLFGGALFTLVVFNFAAWASFSFVPYPWMSPDSPCPLNVIVYNFPFHIGNDAIIGS